MADALVFVVLEKLASIVQQEIEQELRLVAGVRKEVNTLTATLTIIQAVLADAEEKRLKNKAVKVWLEQLKDIVYDADDVLDEWYTRLLISKVQRLDGKVSVDKKVLSYLFSLFSCFKPFFVRHKIGLEMREIRERLDLVAKDKDQHKLTESLIPDEPRQQTSSLVDESEIYGRDVDKEILLSRLWSASSQEMHVQVISIVGTGGFGKTTLAQLILREEKVISHFEMRMWVCVSDPFDLEKVAKSIIEAACRNVPVGVTWEVLHQSLSHSVKGKRFLLVLDDIWSEDDKRWQPLKLSLGGGAPGSRIIVTTRNERVPMMKGSSFTHRLKQLSDDDCWSLFRHIAFCHVHGDLEEFEKIGKEIAKKCKGVPLAARISAGLMRMKTTIREWKTVLASDIWEVKSELEKGFMPELLLSYYTLPSDMKQCFMYCAIFSKDEQIEKDELVKLWMAQGFLGSDGSKDLEIIGSSFFDNLAMRSFFQDFEKNDEGNIIGCKMHDLVHDFAQVLTKNESFILENGREFGSIKLRHLSTSLFESPSIYKERKLRTLRSINKWINTVPLELFQQLTCLRALDLSGSGSDFEKLPVEVARLLHLYLDLSRTCLDELPETICNLLNLQTLRLIGCSDLSKLPEGIGKLSNLRHLELEGTDSLSYFPGRMGTLSSLRTLDKFIVGESEGCKIGELKDLNHLQGSLKISGLEQVADLNEVVLAEIRKKKNLHSLALVFKDYQGEENTQEEYGKQMEGVLKGLQPHKNLEELKINFYPGPKLSTWMSLLSNLIKLELYDCKKCSELPALGRLESLKVLKLNELQSMKHIGCEFYGVGNDSSGTGGNDLVKPVVIFPKLKKLEILNVVDLEDWDIPFQNDAVFFPNLSELRLCWCSRLRALPALGKLKSLQALELMHLERVEFLGPEFLGITSNESEELAPAVAFPELTYLDLYGMWRWDWKDQEELYSRQTIMPCLSKLKMFMCAMIKVVPHYMFSHTLRELEIRYCPQLTGMQPCLPPLLEKLFLGGNVGVLSKSFPISTFSHNNYQYLSSVLINSLMHSMLPQGFNQLTAIRNLHFDNCFYLDFTPEDLKHLTMLRELNICHCPVLKERFDKGVDRSIISNTLEIIIDYIVVQAA